MYVFEYLGTLEKVTEIARGSQNMDFLAFWDNFEAFFKKKHGIALHNNVQDI